MRKDSNPKQTACREEKRRRRFPPGTACIGCGETSHEALELHHVMGREHDSNAVPVCKTCHAKASEDQLREGVPLTPAENLLDRVAAIFDALAAWFRSLAEAMNRLAKEVRAFAVNLDATCPEWRVATA